MAYLPADITVGAILRDPICHMCPHAHHLMPCDTDGCTCLTDVSPGIN